MLNYSLQQNGLPVVRKLTVVNDTDEAITDAELEIGSTPSFCHPLKRAIDYIPPHKSVSLKEIKPILNAEYLSSLSERQSGALHFKLTVGGETVYSEDRELTCLAFDEWHGSSYYPELLSSFVTPNHHEVARIAASAANYMEKWTGDPSLDGYLTMDPTRALQLAASVYSALCDENILYAIAPASFERIGQRVRLCDTILRQKMGNCLDLSLLYASVLEAIGLNPILILTKGHIFAGVWLEELTFPDSVQDDASLLTKRLAAGVNEIAVVECTLFTSGKTATFDDSRAFAEKELSGEEPIEYIIDVKRARLSGILPLPTRILTDEGWQLTDLPENRADTSAAPTTLGTTYRGGEERRDEDIPRIMLWERKLLDLGLRNQLINFRLSKNTLPLLVHSLDELEDALADGKEYSIWAEPADLHRPKSEISFENLHEVGDYAAVLQSEFKNQRLRSIYSETEVKQIMKELYRSAKESIEENGANTLYLALGLLRWYETEKSAKPRYAPLILIPIDIVRRSAAQGYAIRIRDEEARANVTLLEKLSQDFEITITGLDPLPTDEHGIDIRHVLTIIRKAIMSQARWDILESAYLGIFSFSQFVMWNDIRNRTDDLRENKIVISLIEGKLAFEPDDMTVGDKVDESEALLPLPADASQLFAIEAAAKGASFVLHGPPGTGKSQTITALIANSLAQGKTVLFVAEKMAALDVVRRRLQNIGIGDFCLELHSNKSKKKDVLEQLRKASEITKAASGQQYAAEADRIAALRHELDRYAEALHKPLGCGMTLFQLIDRYESVSDGEDITPFSRPAAEALTADDLGQMSLLIDRLVAAGQTVGHPKGHPFAPIGRKEYSQTFKDEVREATEALKSTLDALGEASRALATTLDLPLDTLDSIARLELTAKELLRWLDMPAAWISAEDPDEYFSDVMRMANGYITVENLKAENGEFCQLLANLESELYSAASLCLEGLDAFALSCDSLSEKLELFAPETRDEHLHLHAVASELLFWSRLPAAWARVSSPNQYFTEVASMARHCITAREIRQKYEGVFYDSFWELDAEPLITEYRTANTKWAIPKSLGIGKIFKTLRAHASANINKASLSQYLDDLAAYRKELAEGERLTAIYRGDLDVYFTGNGFDYDRILSDAERAKDSLVRIREELDASALLDKYAGSTKLAKDLEAFIAEWDKQESANEALFDLLSYVSQNKLADNPRESIAALCIGVRDSAAIIARRTMWHYIAGLLREIGSTPPVSDLVSVDGALSHALSDVICSGRIIPVDISGIEIAPEKLEDYYDVITEYTVTLTESDRLLEIYKDSLESLYDESDPDWSLIAEKASVALESARSLFSLTEGHRVRCEAGGNEEIVPQLNAMISTLAAFDECYEGFKELLCLADLSLEEDWLVSHENLCEYILAHPDELKDWLAWNVVSGEARERGLQNVIEAYTTRLEHYQVATAYKKAIYRSLSMAAIDADPTLSGFSGAVYNEQVAQFKAIDSRLTALTRREIFCRLAASVPNLAKEASKSSEAGILQRAIRSGGRGISIRKLFEQIPNLLPRLAPCMLMSPLSAAQYLDPKREPFDIVVFDEASQMPTCKAVGALARGKNAVIVGDPKQMPPTSFFASAAVDEDKIEDEDLESILDDCLSLNMPEAHLLWHYRSRHESLIAFSNTQFYENKLYTFPSVNDRECKVSLVKVDGIFDRGKARNNKAEAEAIVAELVRRCHNPELAPLSVGIVTFNVSQQNLIDDMITDVCAGDPIFERWVYGSGEPLFVKNLENVQGDERDVILFSIGFGPDKDGNVYMNFGPINREGGWRRLNVAVSRARHEMVVFSSLPADRIDLSKTSSEGVAALKAFLEYAGKQSLPDTREESLTEGIFADGMIDSIRAKLESYGYATEGLVGHSEYKVDVAVVDPTDPSKYILGIVLDGESFKNAKTTRDRELSQLSVLQGLGWNIHRVRAMDWWDNSSREITAILDELARLRLGEKDDGMPEALTPQVVDIEALTGADTEEAAEEENTSIYSVVPYRATKLSVRNADVDTLVSGAMDTDILKRLVSTVATEAPISEALLMRRIMQSYGITRAGSRLQGKLLSLIKALELAESECMGVKFYWPDGTTPEDFFLIRTNAEGDNRRDVKDIPINEVVSAVCHVLVGQFGLFEADLIHETAKLFGFARSGSNVEAWFKTAISLAKEQGKITEAPNGALMTAEKEDETESIVDEE